MLKPETMFFFRAQALRDDLFLVVKRRSPDLFVLLFCCPYGQQPWIRLDWDSCWLLGFYIFKNYFAVHKHPQHVHVIDDPPPQTIMLSDMSKRRRTRARERLRRLGCSRHASYPTHHVRLWPTWSRFKQLCSRFLNIIEYTKYINTYKNKLLIMESI